VSLLNKLHAVVLTAAMCRSKTQKKKRRKQLVKYDVTKTYKKFYNSSVYEEIHISERNTHQ